MKEDNFTFFFLFCFLHCHLCWDILKFKKLDPLLASRSSKWMSHTLKNQSMFCENILFLACPPKNFRDIIIIHPIGSFHVFLKARALKQYCKKQNPTVLMSRRASQPPRACLVNAPSRCCWPPLFRPLGSSSAVNRGLIWRRCEFAPLSDSNWKAGKCTLDF